MSEHRAGDVGVSRASDAPALDPAALAAAPRVGRGAPAGLATRARRRRPLVAARHEWDKIGPARGAAVAAARPRATR